MLIDYFSNDAAITPTTYTTISCNNKSAKVDIRMIPSKSSPANVPSSQLKLVLKGDILLKAGKETMLQVYDVKNSSQPGYGYNYEIYSKEGLPLARSRFTNEPNIDMPAKTSDQGAMLPPMPGSSTGGDYTPGTALNSSDPSPSAIYTPELKMIQFPPDTISFSMDKASAPFTFIASFTGHNNLPDKVYADLCDENGSFRPDGNAIFSLGNGNASTQITSPVKDGKATFENIVLSRLFPDKPVDKLIYIKVWVMTNPSIKPIIIKVTNPSL